MTLDQAHEIAVRAEAAVAALFPRTHVVTHVDPDSVLGRGDDARRPSQP